MKNSSSLAKKLSMIMQNARKIQQYSLNGPENSWSRLFKMTVKIQEDVLGKFDESYGLKELFQTMVDQYKIVFDDSVELKPMISPEYQIELRDEPIKPLHLNILRKTPIALRDGAKAELDNLVAKRVLRRLE